MANVKLFIVFISFAFISGCSGIHPSYDGEEYDLQGYRALIVTTSHAELDQSGRATGVWASEMTAPYYEFSDNGMEVDLASIAGGEIPVDPYSLIPGLRSDYDQRYLSDAAFKAKVKDSIKIDDVDMTAYDAVFIAGGWGASYDLGYSDVLGEKISQAYALDLPIGAVCHGPLGLLKAVDPSGRRLVDGRIITAVTDKQIKELGIEETPMHPETELRNAGALFESETAWLDIFANHAVVDGSIVTGQNQNAGAWAAHLVMDLIANP